MPNESVALRRILQSRAFLIVYMVTTVLLLCELAVRSFFALESGPRVMLYGTAWYRNVSPDEHEARWEKTAGDAEFKRGFDAHLASEKRDDTVEQHLNTANGYTKFFPGEHKTTRDVDTGERIPVSINQQGFRGKDFEKEKPQGVVRVLTLGSSSTFGFYDRDDETYPHYLELILNEKCGGNRRFEVINFAIPHADSGNIAAMFQAEGIPLSPDVATLYEGRNESMMTHTSETFWEKVYAVLIHRVLLIAFIDQAISGSRVSVTSAAAQFDVHAKDVRKHFLGNVGKLLQTARAHGVELIIANQQATGAAPYPRVAAERELLRGVTYQEETRRIREKMKANEATTTFEYSLLVHEHMMNGLESWAKENQVTFVDVMGALDADRQYLLSWVHLHPNANRVVASKLAEPILAKFCPTTTTTDDP
jgi:hypothetical protein